MSGYSLSLLAALTLGTSADDRFPLVTDRVQSWVDNGLYAGCSVWIAQGGKVLYEKSFGAHTADTEVYIASAGKWLASATMLAVVDEGKLSLDDPAAKWLPEFDADPKGKATLKLTYTIPFGPVSPPVWHVAVPNGGTSSGRTYAARTNAVPVSLADSMP